MQINANAVAQCMLVGGTLRVCHAERTDLRLPHAPGSSSAELRKMLAVRHGFAVGTRFAMLRHIISNPLHLVVMAAVMLPLMALAMVMMR
jgi:hypothetical protein